MMSVDPLVFPSRWGYHPCSYSTFVMLKDLSKAYRRAQRQVAAWQRWNRKAPHNRVARPRLRNAQGQTIGYGPPVALPEPSLCSIFIQVVQVRRFVDRQGKACPDGYFESELRLEPPTIVEAYDRARRPVAEPPGVTGLGITLEEIQQLHDRLGPG